LSCSYVELLQACHVLGQEGSAIFAKIGHAHSEVKMHIAVVHPVSAPAMVSLPETSEQIEIGDTVTLVNQYGT
jgi:hypothetical protein